MGSSPGAANFFLFECLGVAYGTKVGLKLRLYQAAIYLPNLLPHMNSWELSSLNSRLHVEHDHLKKNEQNINERLSDLRPHLLKQSVHSLPCHPGSVIMAPETNKIS